VQPGRLEARAGSRATSPPARLAAPLPIFHSRGREQGEKKNRGGSHLLEEIREEGVGV
jgi:hypothetical protein